MKEFWHNYGTAGRLSHYGRGRMAEESISREDKNIFLLKYI
jgi:hypothetical protein